MVVFGRKIIAKTLAERRLLFQIGGSPLRVPRGVSPHMVARRLTRAVSDESLDVQFARSLLVNRPRRPLKPVLLTQPPGITSAKAPVAA